MRILFFGTSEFAIPSLKALIASTHEVVALVTQPDRARGRNLKVLPPVTKVVAETSAIPVYQPSDASSAESVAYLESLQPDLFVVIAFGQILRKETLSVPRHCSINLHASLLPKYRGAAPTNWAIINGDRTSGVSIMEMNEKMDEGDILLQSQVPIEPGDTNITLNEKLADLGSKILLEAIGMISGGTVSRVKQDPSKATYAHKLNKEDGLIDWKDSAVAIHNKVRGLIPWPGAYTYYGGKSLKLLNTEVCDYPASSSAEAGEVLDVIKGEGIAVKTGSGVIVIKYLQLEGRKPLDTDSFVRGHRISSGNLLGR